MAATEQADAAKKRAAAHFLKKTTEGYKEALTEYTCAIELVRAPSCSLSTQQHRCTHSLAHSLTALRGRGLWLAADAVQPPPICE
jgi:hypothetical protein